MAQNGNKITLSLAIGETRKNIVTGMQQVLDGIKTPPKIKLQLDVAETRRLIVSQLNDLLKNINVGTPQQLVAWLQDAPRGMRGMAQEASDLTNKLRQAGDTLSTHFGANTFHKIFGDTKEINQYYATARSAKKQYDDWLAAHPNGIVGISESEIEIANQLLATLQRLPGLRAAAQSSVADLNTPTKIAAQWTKLQAQVSQYYQQVKDVASRDPVMMSRFDTLLTDIENKSAPVAVLGNRFRQLQYDIRMAGLETETFGQRLKRTFTGQLGTMINSMGIMFLRQSIGELFSAVRSIDTELTQFQIVTRASDNEIRKFGRDASDTAKQIAASTEDIINAATVYARLGYNQSESLSLSKYTTMYSRVADVGIEDAESNLTAIVKAYGIDVDEISSVLDKMTYVGNNFPISAAQLGEGLQNAASSLVAGGNSFEKSLALLTAAMASTQDISKSSTGLRTITARIRNAETDLEDLGESMDETYNTTAKLQAKLLEMTGVDILESDQKTFKDTYDIMEELAAAWDTLSDIDQASITKMLAGTRQTNVFTGLLKNFQEAQKVMSSMGDATGTMGEAYEDYMSSIEGALGEFSATWQKFSQSVLDSGVVQFFINLGTEVLDFGSKISVAVPYLLSFITVWKVWSALTKQTATSSGLASFMTEFKSLVHPNDGAYEAQLRSLADSYNNLTLAQQRAARAYMSTDQARKAAVMGQAQELATQNMITQHYVARIMNSELLTNAEKEEISTTLMKNVTEQEGNIIDEEALRTDLQRILASKGIVGAQAEQIIGEFGLAAATDAETNAKKRLAAANLQLMASNPMTWITIGISAVTILTQIFGHLAENTKSAAERLSDAKQELDDVESRINSLNSELETTQSRMKELQKMGPLTAVEQEEYNKLVKYNDELQRKIDLENARKRAAQTEANSEFVSAMEGYTGYNYYPTSWLEGEEVFSVNGGYYLPEAIANDPNKTLITPLYNRDDTSTSFEELIAKHEAYEKALEAGADNVEELYQEYLDELAAINQVYDDYAEMAERSDYIVGDNLTPLEKKVNESLDYIADWQDRYAIVTGGDNAITNYLTRIIGTGPESEKKLQAFQKFVGQYFGALKQVSDEYNGLINGNLDYNNRPVVKGSDVAKAGWWDFDLLAPDSWATTYTQGETIGKDGAYYAIEITPILEDGTVLSPEALQEYISKLVTSKGVEGVLASDTDNLIVQIEPVADTSSKAWEEAIGEQFNDKLIPLKDKHLGIVLDPLSVLQDFIKDYADVLPELQDMADWGLFTPENLKVMELFGAAIEDADDKQDEFNEHLKTLSERMKALSGTGEAISKLNDAYKDFNENGEVAFSTLNDIADKFSDVDGIEDYIDILASSDLSSEKLSETLTQLTYASIDAKWATADLANADVDLVAAMLKENGVVNSQEAATFAIAKAKYQLAIANGETEESSWELVNAFYKEVGASEAVRNAMLVLRDDYIATQKRLNQVLTDSVRARIKALGIELKAIKTVAGAYSALVGATKQTGGSESEVFYTPGASERDKWKAIENTVGTDVAAAVMLMGRLEEQMTGFKVDFGGGGSGSSSGSSSSSSGDPWKEAYEKERKELDHLYKMGYITTQTYHDRIEALDRKYFAGREKYLDEHNEILEELLGIEADLYDEQVDIREHELDMLEDSGDYDKIVAIYEELIRLAEERKEAIIDAIVAEGLMTREEAANSEQVRELEEQQAGWQKDIQDTRKDQLEETLDFLDDTLKREQAMNTAASNRELQIIREKERAIREAYKKGYIDYKEYIEQMDEVLADKMDAAQDLYDTAINTIIDEIDSRIDKLQDENEELEKQKELEEALAELEKQRSQRNKRVYVEGVGFVWTQDREAVQQAEDNYNSLLNQSKLDEQIQKLEELKDMWQGVLTAVDDAISIDITEKLFGKDWRDRIDEGVVFVMQAAKQMGAAMGQISAANLLESGGKEAVIKGIKNLGALWGDASPTGRAIISMQALELGRSIGWTRSGDGHWYDENGVLQFAHGGVVDYTGLAMVHGSSGSPEVTFNSADAAKLYAIVHGNGISEIIRRMTQGGSGSAVGAGGLNGGISVSMGGIHINGNVDDDVLERMSSVFDRKLQSFTRQIQRIAIQNAYKK